MTHNTQGEVSIVSKFQVPSWCFEYILQRITESVTYLMSDKGVCRTAPVPTGFANNIYITFTIQGIICIVDKSQLNSISECSVVLKAGRMDMGTDKQKKENLVSTIGCQQQFKVNVNINVSNIFNVNVNCIFKDNVNLDINVNSNVNVKVNGKVNVN